MTRRPRAVWMLGPLSTDAVSGGGVALGDDDNGAVFASLVDLVFPRSCAGCGDPGLELCATCAQELTWPARHSPGRGPPGLPLVVAAGEYGGAARHALIAYKERGRRGLERPLGAALALAVHTAVGQIVGDGQLRDAVVLVPVPSARSAARSRGGDHVARLARRAVHDLRWAGCEARLVPALRVAGRAADAVGLDAAERWAARAGVFAASPLARRCVGRLVLVVDDLITTGATAVDASRALARAGVDVSAIAVVAGTPRLLG